MADVLWMRPSKRPLTRAATAPPATGGRSEPAVFDVVIGVPLEDSGTFSGCERMPAALRHAGLVERLGVRDLGNMQVTIADPRRDPSSGVVGIGDVIEASRVVHAVLAGVLGTPERPLIIGGDGSVLVGAAASLAAQHPSAGLISISGHLDCHVGITSATGEVSGMSLAVVLGLGPAALIALSGRVPAVPAARVIALGARHGEIASCRAPSPHVIVSGMRMVDLKAVTAHPARVGRESARAFEGAGYWLHVDLGVLSCKDLPMTEHPHKAGLTWQQLEDLLVPLLASSYLLGASVVGFDPTLDPDGIYAHCIVELVGRSASRRRDAEVDAGSPAG